MSGALNCFHGRGGVLDAASLTPWSNISFHKPTSSGTNEDRTLTWSVGGARNISASGSIMGSLQYRINSGSWTNYSGAFSLSSGQTLGWRISSVINQSTSVTVNDDTRGAALDTFNLTVTGW